MFEFFKSSKQGEKGKNGMLILLIFGAVAGILLLLWGGAADANTDAADTVSTETDELMLYKENLEKEIKRLCESVAGVDKVTVSVTLSGAFEEIYATEYRDDGEEYVIIGSGASASPLKLTRVTPTVTGIGIVCTGGSTDRIKNALIPLLSTTLSISSNRIYIAEAG